MNLHQQFPSHDSTQFLSLHYFTEDLFLGQWDHFLVVIIRLPLDQEKARHSLEKFYQHYTQTTDVHYFGTVRI